MLWCNISSGILKYGCCDLMDKNAKIVCGVVLTNEKRGLMSCCLYSISYFCLSLHIVQGHKLWLQNKQASQTYVCIKRNPYSAFYLWMNYLLGHHLCSPLIWYISMSTIQVHHDNKNTFTLLILNYIYNPYKSVNCVNAVWNFTYNYNL